MGSCCTFPPRKRPGCCERCRRRSWCTRPRPCGGWGCVRRRRSICWSYSPSSCPGVRPRRSRAGWRSRSTCRRRSRGWRRRRRCCPSSTQVLLARMAAARDLPINRDAASLAARMGQAGWDWASLVLAALGRPNEAPASDALRVWKRLPEWQEIAPQPPPGSLPVQPAEARRRLASMLGPDAEQRPGQADYAAAAASAFAPREARGDPKMVLAEAGTGTGKTLGYIAPASLWAERNKGPVWISTFTRHLQRQVEAELSRLYPEPGGAPPSRGGAQRPGKLPLSSQSGRCRRRRHGWRFAGLDHSAGIDRALGGGDGRRRHPGRRPARMVCRIVRQRHDAWPRRPPRRVHPRRLPALEKMLRRAHHPAGAYRASWWWRTMRW